MVNGPMDAQCCYFGRISGLWADGATDFLMLLGTKKPRWSGALVKSYAEDVPTMVGR